MKIKNMAALLESHMKQNEDKEDEENDKIEEDPFDHMFKLLQNRESKVLNKKKMKKKIFV